MKKKLRIFLKFYKNFRTGMDSRIDFTVSRSSAFDNLEIPEVEMRKKWEKYEKIMRKGQKIVENNRKKLRKSVKIL